MKKFKKGVFIERYESLNAFLDTIKSRPLNKVFDSRRKCCSSEAHGRMNFTKTKSYEESENIMKSGYKEGLNDMMKGWKSVHINSKAVKAVPIASVIGYIPHVPNAIAGIPCSMISHKSVSMKSKIVNIVYDVTASGSVAADDFIKAGRVLLSFIEEIEMRGYRVKLDMMLSSCKGDENSVALIKVKDFRQPVNPLKLSYMMLHPSFLRRQGLKWIETNPALSNKQFATGHGTPLCIVCNGDTRAESKWLKDNGAINDNDIFVSFYDLINTDHITLAKTLGIKQ